MDTEKNILSPSISLACSNPVVVKELIQFNTLKEVQAELVKVYLRSQRLDFPILHNRILRELLTHANSDIETYLSGLDRTWSIKDLEYIFFSFLSKTSVQDNGVVFTPTIISEYMIQEVLLDVTTPHKTICDLSVGAGEFLLAALKELKRKFPSVSAIELVEERLFGMDILADNVFSTKILLALQLLRYPEGNQDVSFNIVQADATAPDVVHQFHQLHVLSGFDFIVGNPPYVKYQQLSVGQRKQLKQQFETCDSGNFNLFYAFVELAYDLIKEDGKVGYIIPNHLLKMASAKSLRAFLIERKFMTTVIDFKDNQIFENAQTYSAILFFDKQPKQDIRYKNFTQRISPQDITDLIGLREDSFEYISYKDVHPDTINLLSKQERYNVQQIERQAHMLTSSTGIATQKDPLYLIDMHRGENQQADDGFYYQNFQGMSYPIEKDITISIIKGSGEKKIDPETQFYEFNKIIYPYREKDGKVSVIPETELADKYPKTFAYFTVIKDELAKRNSGKPTVRVWYEYGRSQALRSYVPKIISPTNSGKPNFTYFSDRALFNNGYAIFGLEPTQPLLDLPLLVKVLNSVVMDYYIRLTSYMISGGYYCYQKKYIKSFTIPSFSDAEITFLKTMEDRTAIDRFLIRKYGLKKVHLSENLD